MDARTSKGDVGARAGPEAAPRSEKEPYVAPRLAVHGTVVKITQTFGLAGTNVPFGGFQGS